MKDLRQKLVNHRLERASQSFNMALLAVEQKYWNEVATELYYTCYYLVTALFAKNDIKTSTHSGVRIELGLKFIKTGILDKKWNKLVSNLFDLRQKSDYEDFVMLTEDDVCPLIEEVRAFDTLIRQKLQE